jgi:probable HAF family extracellular repeat protein
LKLLRTRAGIPSRRNNLVTEKGFAGFRTIAPFGATLRPRASEFFPRRVFRVAVEREKIRPMKTKFFAHILLSCLISSTTAFAQYSFRGIGGTSTSSVLSAASGVSADGTAIAASMIVGSGFRATRWTPAAGHILLGDLPGGTIIGLGKAASANGSFIVGTAGSANGSEAFRWSEAGGMIGLGDLPGEGAFQSTANSISADGSVVVGVSQRVVGGVSQFRAFRWTAAGGMVAIGELPGGDVFAVATDVSADGNKIVGLGASAAGTEGFVWTPTSLIGIGDLPGGMFSSRAQAISADGATIVGASHSARGFEAFRWTAATGMVGLGALPGPFFSSQANDVSANGNVVVGIGAGAGDAGDGKAFVWLPAAGMLDLREYLLAHGVEAPRDWVVSEATGVSADGRTIVGTGINPQGAAEGWIATIEIDDTPLPPPPPPPDSPETLTPASFAVTAGTFVAGNTSNLASSDNSYVTVRALAKNAMQVTMDAQATRSAASELRFAVETSAQGSSTRQDIALFDFVAGSWTTLDTRFTSGGDTVVEVGVTANPARFIDPATHTVRARLTFTPSGAKKTTTTVRIDRGAWTRIP